MRSVKTGVGGRLSAFSPSYLTDGRLSRGLVPRRALAPKERVVTSLILPPRRRRIAKRLVHLEEGAFVSSDVARHVESGGGLGCGVLSPTAELGAQHPVARVGPPTALAPVRCFGSGLGLDRKTEENRDSRNESPESVVRWIAKHVSVLYRSEPTLANAGRPRSS